MVNYKGNKLMHLLILSFERLRVFERCSIVLRQIFLNFRQTFYCRSELWNKKNLVVTISFHQLWRNQKVIKAIFLTKFVSTKVNLLIYMKSIFLRIVMCDMGSSDPIRLEASNKLWLNKAVSYVYITVDGITYPGWKLFFHLLETQLAIIRDN